jgi:hypothetical protein
MVSQKPVNLEEMPLARPARRPPRRGKNTNTLLAIGLFKLFKGLLLVAVGMAR